MKVFITRMIPGVGIKLLEEAGCIVTQYSKRNNLSREELIDTCRKHDALLSIGPNNMDKHFLNECSHLKVISLYSAGFDQIDIAEATRLRIPVGNTPGAMRNSTADTAFLLMLAVSKKAFYLHKTIIKGEWGFFDSLANLGMELNGKTLGIFGLGKIGYEMARRCSGAYRMKVIYHNRHRNLSAEKELNAVKVSFDELLQQSDVLSLHSALTPSTMGLFDKIVFNKMKRTAIFINTARGAMHNEYDLIQALQNSVIWGAGLDVTNPEPMAPDNPLLNMPNVAVLPHIGSATIEARGAMAEIAAQNIIAALHGERLPYIVNPEIYH